MHGTKMDDVATVYLLKLLQTTISTLLEPTALSLQQSTNVSHLSSASLLSSSYTIFTINHYRISYH